MPPIDATPFIELAAARGHRRRFGKHARTILPSATVDVSTRDRLNAWIRHSRKSRGLVLDEVIAFAHGERFKPTRKSKS